MLFWVSDNIPFIVDRLVTLDFVTVLIKKLVETTRVYRVVCFQEKQVVIGYYRYAIFITAYYRLPGTGHRVPATIEGQSIMILQDFDFCQITFSGEMLETTVS